MNGGDWRIPSLPDAKFPVVTVAIKNIIIPIDSQVDSLVWTPLVLGELFFKDAFMLVNPSMRVLPSTKIIWRSSIPPSKSFLFWRPVRGKMPTDENLWNRGCVVVSACPHCYRDYETSDHLFLSCPFAIELPKWLSSVIHFGLDLPHLLCCWSAIRNLASRH